MLIEEAWDGLYQGMQLVSLQWVSISIILGVSKFWAVELRPGFVIKYRNGGMQVVFSDKGRPHGACRNVCKLVEHGIKRSG